MLSPIYISSFIPCKLFNVVFLEIEIDSRGPEIVVFSIENDESLKHISNKHSLNVASNYIKKRISSKERMLINLGDTKRLINPYSRPRLIEPISYAVSKRRIFDTGFRRVDRSLSGKFLVIYNTHSTVWSIRKTVVYYKLYKKTWVLENTNLPMFKSNFPINDVDEIVRHPELALNCEKKININNNDSL